MNNIRHLVEICICTDFGLHKFLPLFCEIWNQFYFSATPSPNSYVPTPSPGQAYQPSPSPGYAAPSPGLGYSPMTPGSHTPSPYTPQTPGGVASGLPDAVGSSVSIIENISYFCSLMVPFKLQITQIPHGLPFILDSNFRTGILLTSKSLFEILMRTPVCVDKLV